MLRSRRIWLGTAAVVLFVLCAYAWWLGNRRGASAGTTPVLVVLHISPQVLAPLVDRPFEWNSPVHETVLGADVTGTSKASGQVSLELLPDEKEAVLQIVLHGQSIAETTAAEGPARVRSQSYTPFVARKRILLDAQGFRSLPAEVEAHAQTQTEGVGSTLPGVRGRIVDRVAQRRAQQAKPEAERVASDDVIRQVADAFDKAVDEHLTTLNRTVIFPKIFSDVTGQDSYPAIHFATTKDCLQVVITVHMGTPHGLPIVEPGDRGPIVAYLNCIELGERLPEVLDTLGRAHGLMLQRVGEKPDDGAADSPLPSPTDLETIRRQGAWLVAIIGEALQVDDHPSGRVAEEGHSPSSHDQTGTADAD